MGKAEKELLLTGEGQKKPTGKDSRKEAVQKIIRHSFRVPWGEEDDGYVMLQGKRYALVNIGSQGIGITCQEDEFRKGQPLTGISLYLGETTMTLNGEVMHLSVEAEGEFLCGIRLHNLSRLDEKTIREALEKKCKEMFRQPE